MHSNNEQVEIARTVKKHLKKSQWPIKLENSMNGSDRIESDRTGAVTFLPSNKNQLDEKLIG